MLCAPRRCGFNDVLNQIWMACQLALNEDRRLIIDTRMSGLWDDLDNYLTPLQSTRITARLTDESLEQLNRMTCYPRRWQSQVDFMHRETQVRMAGAGRPRRASRVMAYVIGSLLLPGHTPFSGTLMRRLRFAGTSPARLMPTGQLRARKEELVVLHSSGGGPHGVEVLRLFTLTTDVRRAVRSARTLLGDDYDAIHIRHTDLRTNYKPLLRQAATELSGRKVLICSDDPAVVAEARAALSESTVISLASPRESAGVGLHKIGAHLSLPQRRMINTAMLVDLMALAGSSRLLVAPTHDGNTSGFSLLATSLRQNPSLVASLLGHAP